MSDREIGLGVVNPRTTEPESVEEIVAKAELALEYYRPEQMFLSPDCGFGCFANRCVNEEEVAVKRIHRIAEAAAVPKEKHGEILWVNYAVSAKREASDSRRCSRFQGRSVWAR